MDEYIFQKHRGIGCDGIHSRHRPLRWKWVVVQA